MEILTGLKQLEGQFGLVGDKVVALKAKLEDLLWRAQRIANAQKNGMPNPDTMFGYDLQHFRRDARAFSTEITGLPVLLGSIERTASYDERAVKHAQAVMRLSVRIAQTLRGLHDTAILAHQHIRSADLKVEAWYVAQEIEELVMKGQGLPTAANKIVIVTSTPPPGAPSKI